MVMMFEPESDEENLYRDRIRDAVIETLKQFDGPRWLSDAPVAQALGWILADNEEAKSEDALRGVADIYALMAVGTALRIRKDRGR
jgi:hypothetical protein